MLLAMLFGMLLHSTITTTLFPDTVLTDPLHAGAFTHNFFTPRQFSTQAFWRTEALTHILSRAGVFTHILEKDTLQHIRFYTQVLLSTSAFALRRFCTHTDAFTHRRFYTQKLLHSYIFAHRSFWHKFGTRQSEFYLSARRLTRVSSGNVSSSTSVRQKKIAMLLQFFDDRQAFR